LSFALANLNFAFVVQQMPVKHLYNTPPPTTSSFIITVSLTNEILQSKGGGGRHFSEIVIFTSISYKHSADRKDANVDVNKLIGESSS